MFNVETHTAQAVDKLRKAANAADKANSNLEAAMSATFVAYLAADHALTAKGVSKIVGDKCPQSKESGNPAATRKSWNTTYFSESAHVAALRTALPNPEGMEPAAFSEAVFNYVKGLQVRQWLKERKAKKDGQEAATNAAVAAAQREPGADEQAGGVLNPGFNPVLSAATSINKSIDALIDMASRDCEEREDANAALTAALTYLSKRLADMDATEDKKAA
jgi:hypothetical protein